MNNDLISRQAIIKDIQNLLKSPYGKDDNIGRVYKRDMAETIIDLCVKNQPTVNQWIEVKDRMPEEDERYKGDNFITVLVTSNDGEIALINRYIRLEDYGYEWGYKNFKEVVAWMPLPEPYKRGEC